MKEAWIAEQSVIFGSGRRDRRAGRIAIELPVQVDAHEARCPVFLDGLDARPFAIAGSSTLQARLLAASYIGMRLHDFLSKGGRVRFPSDPHDVPLQALFGPLLRRARTVQTGSARSRSRANRPVRSKVARGESGSARRAGRS